MPIIPYRRGFRVTEIPIEYRDRIGDTSLRRWSSTLWTFERLWNARKIDKRPVQSPVPLSP